MKSLLAHKKLVVLALLFCAAVLFAASLYIRDERSEYVLKTQVKISEQETTLAAISEITDRDGADAVVESIIKDCSPEDRERFDLLLSKLASLNRSELVEIDQLFGVCANFYAQRKAVMVARFEREFGVYQDLIEILKLVDGQSDTYAQNEEGWKKLVEEEKKRSTLSSRLVAIQGEIIAALLRNASITSDEMQLLIVEGQQIKSELETLSVTIDQDRQAVLAL
jgi:hypothetical protein